MVVSNFFLGSCFSLILLEMPHFNEQKYFLLNGWWKVTSQMEFFEGALRGYDGICTFAPWNTTAILDLNIREPLSSPLRALW